MSSTWLPLNSEKEYIALLHDYDIEPLPHVVELLAMFAEHNVSACCNKLGLEIDMQTVETVGKPGGNTCLYYQMNEHCTINNREIVKNLAWLRDYYATCKNQGYSEYIELRASNTNYRFARLTDGIDFAQAAFEIVSDLSGELIKVMEIEQL